MNARRNKGKSIICGGNNFPSLKTVQNVITIKANLL